MMFRLIPLVFLFAVAVLTSGCASTEDAADDQMNAFHSTPEKPGDSHGWGANVEGMNGGR